MLAADIARDATDAGSVHVVGVLKGAFVFMADLVRQIPLAVTIDFLAVSSYENGTTSTGEVRLLKDLDVALDGRNVVIVEDIVDTGLTLSYLQGVLRTRRPKSLKTACLLSKPSRRKVHVPVEYIGFTIEDHFVVGYGLDHAGQYRNLPYVGVLDDGR
jgi:hypoxanthine phosphoribosyltransferase